MASLIESKDRFDISTGNDADSDRHGIVTPERADEPQPLPDGCDQYLFGGARPRWRRCIGKTLVSSSMIDRVAADLGRRLLEVPVGFVVRARSARRVGRLRW